MFFSINAEISNINILFFTVSHLVCTHWRDEAAEEEGEVGRAVQVQH